MRKFIALSAIAALSTGAFAAEDLSAKIADLESQLKALNAKVNEVKAHDANDNIKWDVNFRTSMDSITYKMADGSENTNPDLLTNRLWLGMAYAPSDNVFFKGKLSYLKAYGDTANHSQSNSAMGVGFANFDWVTNENAVDNTVKVKEAYWLYKNDTLAGAQTPWTISFGRRPSTDGLGANVRENMDPNSPLSHTVNVEFDGASAKFDLDKVTGIPGASFKICTGRGMTNALPRFNMSVNGADYAEDKTKTADIDMYGFIAVPYDDGQYSVWVNWAKANNMIGFAGQDMVNYGLASHGFDPATAADPDRNGIKQMPTQYLDGTSVEYNQETRQITSNPTSRNSALIPSASMAYAPTFKSFGDLELFTAMAKAEGIGKGINSYLDDTRVFASWAMSKTHPTNGQYMLGSPNSETGHSIWIGLNAPCPLTEDGRWGIEWNKGSKYWRSVTYGEDTMTGSKIAARGTAWEVYYNKPITKALEANLRFTQIKYDYTGSNMFFGEDGAPMTMAEAIASAQAGEGSVPVEKAQDIRLAVTYKF